jgi:hypothetical protein
MASAATDQMVCQAMTMPFRHYVCMNEAPRSTARSGRSSTTTKQVHKAKPASRPSEAGNRTGSRISLASKVGEKLSRARVLLERSSSIPWLLIVGLAFLISGRLLYPSRTAIANPSFTSLTVTASTQIDYIGFYVYPVSVPKVTRLAVDVLADHSVAAGTSVAITVVLPDGFLFARCPKSTCLQTTYAAIWHGKVRLETNDSDSSGTLRLAVGAPAFGQASNGLNAVVALPELFYKGPGTPVLDTGYQLSDVGHYNWSSPPANVSANRADWTQTVLNGDVAPQDLAGLNPVSQNWDNFRYFASGAVVALGGTAFLGAFQEWLEARKRKKASKEAAD